VRCYRYSFYALAALSAVGVRLAESRRLSSIVRYISTVRLPWILKRGDGSTRLELVSYLKHSHQHLSTLKLPVGGFNFCFNALIA
jgi:hypothetical protein